MAPESLSGTGCRSNRGIESEQGNLLFIDIGTNGEMALKSNGRYLACSCAAGPALEGMNISNGMRASRGAIEDLAAEGKKLCCTVIGTNKASGICGSGILAAVRAFLKTGMLLPEDLFLFSIFFLRLTEHPSFRDIPAHKPLHFLLNT